MDFPDGYVSCEPAHWGMVRVYHSVSEQPIDHDYPTIDRVGLYKKLFLHLDIPKVQVVDLGA